MSEAKKNYQILVTTADGQSLIWKKQGQVALLPEELVDTWVNKFRPDIWQITASGEMTGVGRATDPTFKIIKVEKIPSSDWGPCSRPNDAHRLE